MTYDRKVEVPLYEFAHGRTGDKGDRSTLSIIPYDPSAYAVIAEQATEERMLAMFRHRGATEARRNDKPHHQAVNFVIENLLQGGVNSSLNLDGHGKTLSFLALTMTVLVTPEVLEAAKIAISD